MILERILVWRFMVLCCGNGSWCGCIVRRIWNNHIWYSKNWVWEVFMWCYRYYHLIYCLYGTVGPWVKVPKALEEDTPMWVYGVGPPPGVLKDTRLVLPLGMSPKRHGIWLALGCCPKIVIIILIKYLVEHWYLMCRLVGVSSLSVVKGWKRKSKNETRKHMHTCLIWLHIY